MTVASVRSVVQKLGIKPGFRIFAESAPTSYETIIGRLPADVKVLTHPAGGLDMVHMFARRAATLAEKLADHRALILPDGMIWVSWPKKSSGQVTDLTDQVVRTTGLAFGLVDTKVCAIGDVWSGLKFVIPKEQRAARG
jgi:hypothetical protein